MRGWIYIYFYQNRPLARPLECSQSGGQNNKMFYMRIDLNSQKRKFVYSDSVRQCKGAIGRVSQMGGVYMYLLYHRPCISSCLRTNYF